ncbi:MAG: TadE/TadG family type IV pilus assembly protein [Gammaproteobacteria bacterium]
MRQTCKQCGAALIELAISLPLLVVITFGITELGRAAYDYNTIAKAARDATRFLSTKAPGDTDSIDDAKCFAVYGNPTCTGAPLAPGLTTDMVSVCDALSCPSTHQAQGTAPVINLVTVTIGGGTENPYTFGSVMPFVIPDIDFSAISVTMKQVL